MHLFVIQIFIVNVDRLLHSLSGRRIKIAESQIFNADMTFRRTVKIQPEF